MRLFRCLSLGLAGAFFLSGAVLAQGTWPAPIPQIQADAQAVLSSPATVQRFPPAKMEFAKMDALPAEIEVSDEQFFRVVQYIRAQAVAGQGFRQFDTFFRHVMKDSNISLEESIIVEAFARNAPITVKLIPASDLRKPVPLIPKLTDAEVAQIRQLQAATPMLTTVQVLAARYLRPSGAFEWMKLFRGSPEEHEIATALLRLNFLRFQKITDTQVHGIYPNEGMKEWTRSFAPSDFRQFYAMLDEDMTAINARYTPKLFPDHAPKN